MQINARMLKRAVVIAAIVGPILIAINQGTDILAGAEPSYSKAALTMLVPFLVSLVSSMLSARETAAARRRNADEMDATLESAGAVLQEILANARRVNEASLERRRILEEVAASARALQASLDDHGAGDHKKSVEEIVETLDIMRRTVDAALEGSAANMRLARDGVGALRARCGNGM